MPLSRWFAATLALLILLGASHAGASSGALSSSAGCGLAGKATGDLRLTTKDGKGVARDYEVLVPASYKPSVPLAVSFSYHGAGGTASDAKGYGIQDAPGAAAAALFVFPQGINFTGFGVGWDDSCSGYDMPFFDNMLAYLSANYCIDTKRVFVSGFSWGGDQVTALACCRGDRIRGVAAASCSDEFNDAANFRTYQNLPCPVSNAAAIRFTHDSVGDSGYPSPLFATTSALYRSLNHCSDSSAAVTPSPCRSFSGCGNSFIDCPYVGLGHRPPPAWATDSWAFFSALSPAAPAPAPAPASPVPSLRRFSGTALGLLLFGAGLLSLRRAKQTHSAS